MDRRPHRPSSLSAPPGQRGLRLISPVGALFALALTATPAAAVRLAEFNTGCADGTPGFSYIELQPTTPDESFDRRVGMRAIDHNGAVLWEIPDVYIEVGWLTSRFIGARHLAAMTPAVVQRLGAKPEKGWMPNLTLPGPIDPLAGSIVLFRTSGAPAIVDRVDYGPGRAAPTPPQGASTSRSGTSWVIDTGPTLDMMTNVNPLAIPDCLGVAVFTVHSFMLRCDDGSRAGQFIELECLNGGLYDPRLHLSAFDRNGALIGEISDLFGPLSGGPHGFRARWLVGGAAYVGTSGGARDLELPFELDPIGGRLELSGTFDGVPWVEDALTYGGSGVPAPPAGYAYDRNSNRMVLPQPKNSDGVTSPPPLCAYGSNPATPFIRELGLQCLSGSTEGQFVELGVLGAELVLDETFELRAIDRNGNRITELPGMFGSSLGTRMTPASAFLVRTGPTDGADAALAAPLDTVAGTIQVVHHILGAERVVSALAYGGVDAPGPPRGMSLASTDGLTYRIESYPTPTSLHGAAPIADCLYRLGTPNAVIRQLALRCRDDSPDGLFVELESASGTHADDSDVGLELAGAAGESSQTLYPLFPLGASAIAPGGTAVIAGPGFEARAGIAPRDLLASSPPAPHTLRLFRRDPRTGTDRIVQQIDLPASSLSPGHGLARDAGGRFNEIVTVRPSRGDGTPVASDCYSTARPDAVRIRELLLRARDGGDRAQYVELESTSPDAVTSPGLSLRAFDHAGARLFDTNVPPVWPGATEPAWPQAIVLLAGGPEASDRYGISMDLALPGVLDSLGGRLELVLQENGSERIVQWLAYGAAGVPTPPAGATLAWTANGFAVNGQPTPQNSRGEDARRDGLGVCADRELLAGGRDRYRGSDASASAAFGGASARYDARRGTFHLESGASTASAKLPDRFRVVGVPAGTPATVQVHLPLAATVIRTCPGDPCMSPHASVTLRSGAFEDSAAFAFADEIREMHWSHELDAGESFDVDLQSAVTPGALETDSMILDGRLGFDVLPDGARVVSCLGYDSELARPVRAPRIEPLANGVRVGWAADRDVVQRATLERSTAPDAWEAIGSQTPSTSGAIEFVDSRAERGRELAYRLRWEDLFGTHVTPAVRIRLEPAPGFALDGVRPNPSTGIFAAQVRIPEAGVVRLEALDIAGRVVASQSAWRPAGIHQVPIARDGALAPGVYVVRLHYRGMVSRTTAIVLR